MTTLAITANTRRLLTRLHRWGGLACLAFMFAAGLTGSILAFRWEIDTLLNPQLFRVVPGQQHLPYAKLISSFEEKNPDLLVSSLALPQAPDHALRVGLKSRMEALAKHRHVPGMKSNTPFNQAFIDPYTGEILGKRNTSAFHLDRVNFIPFMLRLHYTLFLNQWGVWLMGGCAVLWLLGNMIGLALSWPTGWWKFSSWKSIVSLRVHQGSYKLNYDLHRAAGVLTFPVLIVVAFTSIYLNLPALVKPVIEHFSPLNGNMNAPGLGSLDPSEASIPLEEAIAIAGKVIPDAQAISVSRDFTKGLYSIRLRRPGDVSHNGNNWLFVGMREGRISYRRLADERSAGDTFVAWQVPLHGGRAFGIVGQTLICLSAIALCALCVTGTNIWLRKRRGNKRARA